MRWRSQPETLVSLVIMWGSIPRHFTQNDFHSAITNFPLHLSTRSSTAEIRCDAWSIFGEKSRGYIVDGYLIINVYAVMASRLTGYREARASSAPHRYLPIQKEEKISPRRSSAPRAPVMAPSSAWTRLRSSASNSPA